MEQSQKERPISPSAPCGSGGGRPITAPSLWAALALFVTFSGSAQDPSPGPTASRASLMGTQPLAKHVATLVQQTNNPIDLSKAQKDRLVRLDIADATFWEALERLAAAADHRLVISSRGAAIALVGGSDAKYQTTPVDFGGAFRTSVKRVVSKLELETGVRTTEIVIEVVWEPRFKAFYAEASTTSVVAADNKPLKVVDDGASKMPVSGQAIELTVRLLNVPRSINTLARLEGQVKFVGTSQLLQFTFPADKSGVASTQKQAGVGATLESFQKRSRIWTAVVQLEYPKGGPELESFQSFLLDNECWLERDGMKVKSVGFELLGQRGGAHPIHYHFREDSKTGFMIAKPRDWKLVLRTPGRITEAALRFSLANVPLP